MTSRCASVTPLSPQGKVSSDRSGSTRLDLAKGPGVPGSRRVPPPPTPALARATSQRPAPPPRGRRGLTIGQVADAGAAGRAALEVVRALSVGAALPRTVPVLPQLGAHARFRYFWAWEGRLRTFSGSPERLPQRTAASRSEGPKSQASRKSQSGPRRPLHSVQRTPLQDRGPRPRGVQPLSHPWSQSLCPQGTPRSWPCRSCPMSR